MACYKRTRASGRPSSELDPTIQPAERTTWREQVKTNPTALNLALQSWLSGPLYTRAVLLIVDDLERILETPKQSEAATGVAESYRDVLRAVLSAFESTPTRSRLIVTSRYDFALPDGRAGDLAAVELDHHALGVADANRFGEVGEHGLKHLFAHSVGDVPHRAAGGGLDEAIDVKPLVAMVTQCKRTLAFRRPHAACNRLRPMRCSSIAQISTVAPGF
jgi:hypothetical protein